MENSIHLSIITPEDIIFDADVEYVADPGTLGDFGVYKGHANLLSSLRIGCLSYKAKEQTVNVFVSGGFVDVNKEAVTVLTDVANHAGQIDVDRAMRSKERAEARLREKAEDLDLQRAQDSLKRALVRLQIAMTA